MTTQPESTTQAAAHQNRDLKVVRHVIFIGETGSGKSSVINLIAGDANPPARVTSDATPCTLEFASYDVSIGGRTYKLWDTPGLNQPSGLMKLFRRSTSTRASKSLRRFLQERGRNGELDLVVFCVRGSRVHAAMSTAYNTFCRPIRQKAVPVTIAITHLEKEQPTMDAWWQNNEKMLKKMGLEFNGYACITCLSPHHRRLTSHGGICSLILEKCQRQSTLASDMEYLNDPQKGCVVC